MRGGTENLRHRGICSNDDTNNRPVPNRKDDANLKFRRIDEDTIRCIITTEEMESYGIELEDFFRDKEKVSHFLEELLKEASEEVGELSHHGMMSMQVMPLGKNELAITFSEKSIENGFSDMLDYIRETLRELGDDLPKDLKDRISGVPAIAKGNGKSLEEEFEKKMKEVQPQEEPQTYDTVVFEFSTIDQLAKLGRILSTFPLESMLYRERKLYYLILHPGQTEDKVFRTCCELASEYSEGMVANDMTQTFMEEHARCIIESDALGRLAMLV